jgi:type IV pilus assembly protein PilX
MSLVMALIFLTILVLTGTSATMNTNLQEHMAGNTRNRDLALEAGEAALKDAEKTLTTWRTGVFDGSGGLLAYDANHANDAAYWGDSTHWGSYRRPTQTLSQVVEQPKYVVEKMANVGTTEYYRVTARGVGGESNAVVVLQALYTYTP